MNKKTTSHGESIMKKTFLSFTTILALSATPALAHTDAGSVVGMVAGLAHPLGGADHVLAMVAVGILAAQLGKKSRWSVPAAFVGMMIVGGLLGGSGFNVPFIEQGIVGSVIILGAVIAVGRRLSIPMAMSLAGFLAVFHGHAHGAEMPMEASGLAYGAGFVMATIVLHAVGIGLGIGLRKIADTFSAPAIRMSGLGIALAGIGLPLL